MRIARVFPTKTNMTPTDEDSYYGNPELFMPKHDEIHISTVFTWDKNKAKKLAYQWESYGDVKIGGPAFGDSRGSFIPGMYLKKGITITSRGCPCKCDFCLVPKIEGKIKELKIHEGYIVQDNNLLACSESHIDNVFKMLKKQGRQIFFKGGLQASRINDWVIDRLRSIKLGGVWLAYDKPKTDTIIKKAVEKLRQYFSRDQVNCYVLIGYKDDTIEYAEKRLKRVIELGMFPFAMRYRNDKGNHLQIGREWKVLARKYILKAIINQTIKEMGLIR